MRLLRIAKPRSVAGTTSRIFLGAAFAMMNVVDLIDELKKSRASETAAPAKGKKPSKATAGQKEMVPIEGKKPAAKKAAAAKPERSTGRRKAG